MSTQVLHSENSTQAPSDLPPQTGTATLTCLTCRQFFTQYEAQRQHYKSDFHRFNMKRKIVGLPSVTIEVFEQKLKEISEANNNENVADSPYCKACGKRFSSKNTFEQHLTSKKHKTNEEQLETEGARVSNPENKEKLDEEEKKRIESMTDEEWVEHKLKTARRLKLEECLFCDSSFENLQKNLEHMTSVHSFFIPDLEFLTDLDGLITYLGEKITVAHACLYCPGKTFGSLRAVRDHMNELCHCKLNYQDADEYEDFYDFSTTHDQKIPDKLFHLADNGLELVLPGNKVVGHRSLAIYYKQKSHDRRLVVRSLAAEHQRLQQIEEQKRKWVPKKSSQTYQKSHMRLGIKANRLQHFFRADNPL
eukprot:TRINITY_DN12428_c0_g1_i1.p1 TRINITY_DN12428_c0_g1~~TRINITY_DN12428_c0_g1_i1.p1  ORF type:complete len:372 (-),score=61.38 TRINITY_DN12428_c0_g1_i1:43-1134(-)